MKKLVLTTVCALAMTGAAVAQGLVNWGSISFSAMTAQTNSTQNSPFFGGAAVSGGAVGATAIGGPGFYYELLDNSYTVGGPAATIPTLASLLTWSDTGLGATNNASGTAGRLNPIAPNASATVPWAAGVTDSIVLIGWSANLGSSWGVVSNELKSGSYQTVLAGQQGFFGVSATGYITGNTAPSPGATMFGTAASANGLPISSLNTQLYLLPVPEPATMALMGLGGLSLLLFRRQRKN
jgi:hypothetical protein